MTSDTDLPPLLPPPIPKAAAPELPVDQVPPAAASRASGWSVRNAGLAALGFGFGGLGASLATWAVVELVRAEWGVSTWGEYAGWSMAFAPLLLFGLACVVEKPAAILGVIGLAAIKLLLFKQHLSEFIPNPPPGGFDLVTMATAAGVFWGLIGAMIGASVDTGRSSASDTSTDSSSEL